LPLLAAKIGSSSAENLLAIRSSRSLTASESCGHPAAVSHQAS